MRNTDNGVIGRDQTAVMARLALDELITSFCTVTRCR